ncbi:MAG: hypothetical protein DMG29_04515 [Acidobacteria bacterium]|nr:MAG: hypothetical protein DMG29_04515 [Acidobacteriota bacterium]
MAYKARITVSLSKDTFEFLKLYCVQVKAPSMSALIESIIADIKRRKEMEELNARVAAYYDSLSAEESQEQVGWAELAESELAASSET